MSYVDGRISLDPARPTLDQMIVFGQERLEGDISNLAQPQVVERFAAMVTAMATEFEEIDEEFGAPRRGNGIRHRTLLLGHDQILPGIGNITLGHNMYPLHGSLSILQSEAYVAPISKKDEVIRPIGFPKIMYKTVENMFVQSGTGLAIVDRHVSGKPAFRNRINLKANKVATEQEVESVMGALVAAALHQDRQLASEAYEQYWLSLPWYRRFGL
jgi:hypothetical protein